MPARSFRPLALLALWTLLAACGDDPRPAPGDGGPPGAPAAVGAEIPPAWQGLTVSRFRVAGPEGEIEVLDLLAPEDAARALVSVTVRSAGRAEPRFRATRGAEEARSAGGGWLLEWPATKDHGPLEVELRDDEGVRFVVRAG